MNHVTGNGYNTGIRPVWNVPNQGVPCQGRRRTSLAGDVKEVLPMTQRPSLRSVDSTRPDERREPSADVPTLEPQHGSRAFAIPAGDGPRQTVGVSFAIRAKGVLDALPESA